MWGRRVNKTKIREFKILTHVTRLLYVINYNYNVSAKVQSNKCLFFNQNHLLSVPTDPAELMIDLKTGQHFKKRIILWILVCSKGSSLYQVLS